MKHDGTLIYANRDEYGLIQVVDTPVTRKLFFDSPIEQSCLYHNAPMTLNFEYQDNIIQRILAFIDQSPKDQPMRLLMLGLGGGTIVHHLFHSSHKLQMTVVELRQVVIDCAYEYFQLPDEPEIDVLQGDAVEFIQHNQHQFDAIIVDIFDAHGLPSELSQTSFLEQLRHNLKTSGLLIFNLWHEWNQNNQHGKAIPTEEAGLILDYWQELTKQNSSYQLNSYNIKSSQNLILEILKNE